MLASPASTHRQIYLAVPKETHQRALVRKEKSPHKVQEIQCRQISVNQLNYLLTSIFPSGCYDVDVDQNVYKIRAPRTISEDELRGSRF
ncbi:hypothetical protein QBC43DRAFT_325524 [Cladorrhinum sp. PSN259]|nr:hypothetical protein QBC43DRAFT_325524 [Cladorrhinum sp. PSN259]